MTGEGTISLDIGMTMPMPMPMPFPQPDTATAYSITGDVLTITFGGPGGNPVSLSLTPVA